MVYVKWKRLAHKFIEVIPVEIPGRGTRLSEELCKNMKDLVADIYNGLAKEFYNEDYMFFGHSMGALIAYHLSKKIMEEGVNPPKHLFISGSEAPHLHKNKISCLSMTEKEFIDYVYNFGGTPKELFDNENFRETFLPILKNDLQLIEKCGLEQPRKLFEFGITGFYGTEDDIKKSEIEEWSRYTTGSFISFSFNGGHFFIHNYIEDILSIICNH